MTRKVTIPIYHGDDFERLAELRREVDVAERLAATSSPLRLGDEESSAVQDAKDAYDKFVDEAAERAEMWELHPIGHEEWRALLRDHPPRRVPKEAAPTADVEKSSPVEMVVHPDDEGFDVNTETFPKALLTFVDPDDSEVRTVAVPDLSPDDLRKRVKRLALGEFESIWMAAYMLNTGGVADPKLSRFSPAGPRSSET